jgi:hypothetical protein
MNDYEPNVWLAQPSASQGAGFFMGIRIQAWPRWPTSARILFLVPII